MTLFLLSLTGIPPTAGFFAKAYVILAAVQAGGPLTLLAVIAVLNAAAAAFYYLRVVVYMFMRDPASDAPALRHGALLWGGLAAATALTIVLGLFPTPCSTSSAARPPRHLDADRRGLADRAVAPLVAPSRARERREQPADVARRASDSPHGPAAPGRRSAPRGRPP